LYLTLLYSSLHQCCAVTCSVAARGQWTYSMCSARRRPLRRRRRLGRSTSIQ